MELLYMKMYLKTIYKVHKNILLVLVKVYKSVLFNIIYDDSKPCKLKIIIAFFIRNIFYNISRLAV